MTHNIRFGTFNVGQGYNEYRSMLAWNENEFNKLEEEEKSLSSRIVTDGKYSDEALKQPKICEEIYNKARTEIITKIENSVADEGDSKSRSDDLCD